MKPIKIVPENQAAIRDALKAINGRAEQHTFTSYGEIEACAEEGERQLRSFGVTKANCAGARFIAESGSKLPNKYNHKAIGTRITLERRSSLWYLAEIHSYDLWPNHSPKRRLQVTQEQADEATRRLLTTVEVLRPATKSVPVDHERAGLLCQFVGDPVGDFWAYAEPKGLKDEGPSPS